MLLDDTMLLVGTARLIRDKKVGAEDATSEQLNKLEDVRRLLFGLMQFMRVSVLWTSPPPSFVRASEGTSTAKTTSAPLNVKLPPTRHNTARSMLLTALFRWVGKVMLRVVGMQCFVLVHALL